LQGKGHNFLFHGTSRAYELIDPIKPQNNNACINVTGEKLQIVGCASRTISTIPNRASRFESSRHWCARRTLPIPAHPA
jgi:hypothetical protein